ncbi:MAG: glycoside hydrolase family 92 protein, partial [Chitinophagaceae bacterium]
ASIGLFDVQGGAAAQPRMQLASPIFDKVTITLDRKYYPGESIRIVTRNNSSKNLYIQRVAFQGKDLATPSVSFRELVNGGSLEYTMGDTPGATLK